MEAIIFGIIDYMMGFIEIALYDGFMCAKFDQVQNRLEKKKWLMYIVGSIGIYSTSLFSVPIPIALIIHVLILVYMGHCRYKKTLAEELTFTLFYLGIIFVIDLFVVTTLGGVRITSHELMGSQTTYFYVALSVISKSLLIVIVKVFIRLEKSRVYQWTTEVKGLMGCGFMISLMSLYFLSIIFWETLGRQSNYIRLLVAFTALGIFLNNMIIYYALQKLSDWINKRKEYEVIQYQNEMLIKTALEKDEMNKEVRKIWHDFNNHISCIDMLLQMNNVEKARSYIQHMNASCQTTYMGINTGNDIADVVINQKYVLAKSKDIDLIVVSELNEDLPINAMDLCALLCNSLDNAIEASRQIKMNDTKKINLYLKVDDQHLFINVVNDVKKEALANKKLVTTKKNKSKHGIGMLSMKAIVERYKGNLTWKYENNKFVLEIII